MSVIQEFSHSSLYQLFSKERIDHVSLKTKPRKASYLECVSDDEDNDRKMSKSHFCPPKLSISDEK